MTNRTARPLGVNGDQAVPQDGGAAAGPRGTSGCLTAAAEPRLDEGTKLGIGWWVTYHPGASEGSLVRGYVAQREGVGGLTLERRSVRRAEPLASPDPPPANGPPEPEGSTERADRRARGQVRRYAVANGVTRLLTLTYRPPQPTDPRVVLRDVAGFLKLLRADRPELAYVRVLERHESGALHVHVGLGGDGRKLDPDRLARLWGRGFIDIRKIRAKCSGRREAARSTARYLAKYVTKDGPGVRSAAGHRYEVRQGRQPVAVRVAAWDHAEAWRELVRLAGGELPRYEWSSSGEPDWTGPPVDFVSW